MPQLDSSGPATGYFAVTPSDSVGLGGTTRGLYIGTGGNVVAVRPDGVAVTFTAVPTGTFMPVCCIRVNSTNTTASNIVALV